MKYFAEAIKSMAHVHVHVHCVYCTQHYYQDMYMCILISMLLPFPFVTMCIDKLSDPDNSLTHTVCTLYIHVCPIVSTVAVLHLQSVHVDM